MRKTRKITWKLGEHFHSFTLGPNLYFILLLWGFLLQCVLAEFFFFTHWLLIYVAAYYFLCWDFQYWRSSLKTLSSKEPVEFFMDIFEWSKTNGRVKIGQKLWCIGIRYIPSKQPFEGPSWKQLNAENVIEDWHSSKLIEFYKCWGTCYAPKLKIFLKFSY